ncbi:CPA2 family monovalent cation:H+ antiporter-2 [Rhodobacteraceae bacterium MBR-64]|jgi:CPA2 family monovalent cation:H+ antiporter-2
MEGILFQASIYLLAAVVIVPVAVRLGLGSVLGYLAAGILIGPVLGLVGSETADLQHVAEFGVVLMLFVIGLELEPRVLWSMRHRLLGLGGLQVMLTMAAVTGVGIWLGESWQISLAVGMILSLSSTAIVLQTLNEKNLMRSAGGRSTFAVLLTQDIAVVPMLAVVPLLALHPVAPTPTMAGAAENPGDKIIEAPALADTLIRMVADMPGWSVTVLTLGIVTAIMLGGHYLTRPVFRFVHAARLPEMSTFISLLIVLGIAFLMTLVGLSPALGTFLAGVVLANSEFRHQLVADIEPFKGLLLGLFFITVGAGIDFWFFWQDPLLILGLTLGLIALKGVILFVLAALFRLRGRDRWLFTLGLAQAGEFGFLLISFSLQQNVLSQAIAQVVLLVVGFSMLLTPVLFILYEAVARRSGDARGPEAAADEIDEQGRVIIAGIGRFGQVVNRLVRMSGVNTVVLDSDMATIQLMRRFGVKGFFGDPARPELLQAAGLGAADVLVVAVDSREAAIRIVRYARAVRPDIHIVARAHDRVNVFELHAAGADDIVRETFDASIRAGRYVLENSGFTEYEAAQLSQTYYKEDRKALRELAKVWRPGVPVHENEAYVARSRQFDADLETALLEHLQNRETAAQRKAS